MITWDSVDLPEPFGPMTAWTSPERTVRSIPLRISLPATPARRPLDLEHVVGSSSTTTSTSPSTTRASYTGTGRVAGSDVGLAGLQVEARCRASSTRAACSSAQHLALGQRDVLVAAAVADGVDVVAEAHDAMTWPPTSTRWASPVAQVVERRRSRSTPVMPAPPSSLAATAASRAARRSVAGNASNTSAKNPATISRSATRVGTPRLSR